MRRRVLPGLALALVALGALIAWGGYPGTRAGPPPRPPGTFVEVEGVRLHALCAGPASGRAILLIHGNPGSVLTWADAALPALAVRHRACALDRPGHGWSERPPGRADTVEAQARLLHGAGQRLGLRRPVVVAHSWGGAAALAYALEFPEDVAGLVLVAGVAYPDDQGFAAGAERIALHPVVGPVALGLLGPWLAWPILDRSLALSFAPDPVPADYRAAVRPLWTRPETLRAISADEAALDTSLASLRRRYGDIRVPAAILVGDADRLVDPARHARRLARELPGAALTVLPGAGHELHRTRAAAVAAAIHALRASAR